MTEDQACTDIKECPRCDKPQLEDGMIINADIVYQGTIPLLVFYYRCPICGHAWDEAHEPVNRPTLEAKG